MSNASNLSTLANVLDDGSSGQFLKSTGSGGVAFDTVAAGATVYSSASDLPLTGNTVGDMAYVSAATTAKVVNQTTGSVSTEDATRLYIYSGTGWYSVAFITQNPTINTVQDAGGGSTPFTLATDGSTATVVTITAADPEGVPLTYGYSVTSGSLNGSTVAQGTGSNTNVFTVTPHASQDATFTITFTASDGINQATSANAFSLSFITIVTDSNHTTLLATATGTSDNNNITDSSSNSHSITVNGDAHAGTFSPYRSGGYSWDFDGSTSNDSSTSRITATPSSTLSLGTGDYTVEMWVKSRSSTSIQSNGNYRLFEVANSSGGERIAIRDNGYGDSRFSVMENGSQLYRTSSGTNPYTGEWEWLQIVRDNGATKAYVNGSERGSASSTTDISGINKIYIGSAGTSGIGYGFNGNIRDFRISNIARSTTVPTEPLESDSNTLILACNKGHLIDQGPNSIPLTLSSSSNKSDPTASATSPYDYEEYDAADHGGSVYFDGTGDYVEMPGHSSLVLDTSNFTLEFWYKHVANVTTMRFLGNNYQNSTWGGGRWTMGILSGKLTFQSNSLHGTGNYTSSTVSIDDGAWHHCSLTRDGSTFTLRVDGNDSATYTNSGSLDGGNSYGFTVGGRGNGTETINGYISDFKLVKGTVHYTADFTPPTAPLSSSGAALHIKGTDASIIDKSQVSNLKLFGNTTGSTTQAKFSNTKSMYFDGSGDYVFVPASSLLDISSSDITIEGYFYTTSTSVKQGVWEFYSTDDNYARLFFDGGNGNVLRLTLYSSGTQRLNATGTTALSINTWYHIAVTRDHSSGAWKTFIGGVQDTGASGAESSAVDTSLWNFAIGRDLVATDRYWNGYIQDFRITKGLARYTANFTPPSAPLKG